MSQMPSSPLARRIDKFVASLVEHWLLLILIPMLLINLLPFLAPIAMYMGWPGLGVWIYTIYMPFCHQLPQRSWFLLGEQFTYTLAEIQAVYPHLTLWDLRFFYGTPDMGWKVAWSDRMISFYTMTPVFGLLYAEIRRRRGPIAPLTLYLFLLTLFPLTLDVMTHFLNDIISPITVDPSLGGFRDTNQWLAQLTADGWPGFYAGDHFGAFNWWARLLTGLLAAWGIAFYLFPWIDHFLSENQIQTPSGVLQQ